MGRLKFNFIIIFSAILSSIDCRVVVPEKINLNETSTYGENATEQNGSGKRLHDYSCIGADGSDVDWYILYKIPGKPDEKYRYLYIDSSISPGSRNFEMAIPDLFDEDSMLSKTLEQFLDNDPGSENYFVYSNQIEADAGHHYAHAKGIAVFGASKGFWLWHTIPRLAPLPGDKLSNIYPNTQFGQVAACVSFNTNSYIRENIQNHLSGINAYCIKRYKDCTGEFKKKTEACLDETPVRDGHRRFEFNSVNGLMFTVYTKSRTLDDDIYHAINEYYRGDGWLVQSWRPAGDNLVDTPYANNGFRVSINYYDRNSQEPFCKCNEAWEYTVDHSKVALSGESWPDFCIGDLNRAYSQYTRGGGIMCFPAYISPREIFIIR